MTDKFWQNEPLLLVTCLNSPSENLAGLTALVGIVEDKNRESNEIIVSSGVIPPLISLLNNGNTEVQRLAMFSLYQIMFFKVSHNLIIKLHGISKIIPLINSPDSITRDCAIRGILNLAVEENLRPLLVESGAVKALFKALSFRETREITINPLVLLTGKDSEFPKEIIPHLISLLSSKRPEVIYSTLQILGYPFKPYAKQKKIDITLLICMSKGGVVSALMTLLGSKTISPEEGTMCLCILILMYDLDSNKETIELMGGIPILIDMICSDTIHSAKELAFIIISKLSSEERHCNLIRKCGGIEVLVTFGISEKNNISTSELDCFVNLSRNSKNRELIIKAGGKELFSLLNELSKSNVKDLQEKSQLVLSMLGVKEENRKVSNPPFIKWN